MAVSARTRTDRRQHSNGAASAGAWAALIDLVALVDPARTGRRVLAIVGALAGLTAVLELSGVDFPALDVTRPWNVPAYAAATLLLCAAALALLCSHADRIDPRVVAPRGSTTLWLPFAALLALLALETAAHLLIRADAGARSLGAVALGLALVVLGARLATGPLRARRVRLLFCAGVGVWLAALAAHFSAAGGARLAEALLELAGSVLLAAALLLAARDALGLAGSSPRRSLLELVVAVPVRGVAVAIFVVIAVLGALGAFHLYVRNVPMLDLDSELTVPMYFNGGLLLLAAGLAALRGRADTQSRTRWRLLAGFFLFMSFDEIGALHETISHGVGLYWQVLYVPIMLIGGVAWLGAVLSSRNHPPAPLLFIVGAGCYVLAQSLESLQWGGGEPLGAFKWTSIPEELLEMSGVALWCLAILVGIRAVAAVRASDERELRLVDLPGPPEQAGELHDSPVQGSAFTTSS